MKHYMIFGYGGIGKALVQKLSEIDCKITIVSRKKELPLSSNIATITLDNFDSYIQYFPPNYLINTIGLLHDKTHQPEKKLLQLDVDWLDKNMEVNVWPTIKIAKAIAPLLTQKSTLVLMSLSARVGSISDNRLGGWYSYRMSKAALNMLIKTIAIEWRRSAPQATIVGYHPGTVATDLSAPFQRNVSPEKLFTPQVAAEYLLTHLHQLTSSHSGHLIDWQGKTIPL